MLTGRACRVSGAFPAGTAYTFFTVTEVVGVTPTLKGMFLVAISLMLGIVVVITILIGIGATGKVAIAGCTDSVHTKSRLAPVVIGAP